MVFHEPEQATGPLRRFADDARDRISLVDEQTADWIHQALLAADPYPATRKAALELGLEDAVVIAAGKAAVPMALAWQEATGQTGLAVVPTKTPVPPELSRWQVIEGEHPVPGPGSHQAGRTAWELSSTGKDVALLLSGGASSMMEASTVDEQEHAKISSELHALGLPIATWNAARALLSRIKSGGLAAHVQAHGGELHTIYVSDVPGDDPRVVGSGPGSPMDPKRLIAAIEPLPGDLRKRLLKAAENRPETPKPSPARLLVPRDAPARKAEQAVREAGHRPNVLDPIDADVDEIAPRIKKALQSAEDHEVLIVWGEPLVTLPDRPGPGGRTTQLLCTLWTHPEAHHTTAALMTTDGLDGASGYGGCYARLDPSITQQARESLQTWQTAAFLDALPPAVGGGVPMRRTGANCADIGILKPDPRH